MRGRFRLPPTRLKRGKAKESPRIRLTIFVEGAITEKEYFKAVRREAENPLVEIEGPCGVPDSVVNDAIAYKKRRRRRALDSFERADQVWAVFDCDEHIVAGAFGRAEAAGIGVAFSNPCFELWGLLHLGDHDAPLDRHVLQRLLQEKMPNYDRYGSKCFDYEQMKGGYTEACLRAEKMGARRITERDPMGNPYTSVNKLVQLIFENGKRK
jgi:hypothetical protein